MLFSSHLQLICSVCLALSHFQSVKYVTPTIPIFVFSPLVWGVFDGLLCQRRASNWISCLSCHFVSLHFFFCPSKRNGDLQPILGVYISEAVPLHEFLPRQLWEKKSSRLAIEQYQFSFGFSFFFLNTDRSEFNRGESTRQSMTGQ